MRIRRSFELNRPRDDATLVVCCDETRIGLFPDSETEIIESTGDRRTTRTRYSALGREGTATFHFTFLLDGDVHFEKVCDGVVWTELSGRVTIVDRGATSRLTIEMQGRTKPLIPGFTVKGQLEKQLEQMTAALKRRLEGP